MSNYNTSRGTQTKKEWKEYLLTEGPLGRDLLTLSKYKAIPPDIDDCLKYSTGVLLSYSTITSRRYFNQVTNNQARPYIWYLIWYVVCQLEINMRQFKHIITRFVFKSTLTVFWVQSRSSRLQHLFVTLVLLISCTSVCKKPTLLLHSIYRVLCGSLRWQIICYFGFVSLYVCAVFIPLSLCICAVCRSSDYMCVFAVLDNQITFVSGQYWTKPHIFFRHWLTN